ncbi:MAG: AAA family ATPase, partial [Lentisphaeria bacterium]|nr:AAA family ATPase [Lentisphaeria bacterium]
MKDITSSVYSFEKLRQEGYLYVDKTEYIWNLINPAGGSYFLSRPRRFGKSLTVSTLKAIFEGKKELFKDLAIYDKPYDWKTYPVIHLDLANCDIKTADELVEYLIGQLTNIADSFHLQLRGEQLSVCFENLINDIAVNGNVVIFVDEYDK